MLKWSILAWYVLLISTAHAQGEDKYFSDQWRPALSVKVQPANLESPEIMEALRGQSDILKDVQICADPACLSSAAVPAPCETVTQDMAPAMNSVIVTCVMQ